MMPDEEKNNFTEEILRVQKSYEKRKNLKHNLYDPSSAYMCMIRQEKERKLLKLFSGCNLHPLTNKTLLEIGCGNGSNLLQLIQLGFSPDNLHGNELLPERLKDAADKLPSAVNLIAGNALDINLPDESFDIVYQSMVFSSILDKSFQEALARKMWKLVKPGGGILWYDFIYNNPQNKDVNGISSGRVKELFGLKDIKKYKITLAPPISRIVTRIHPALYTVFNSIPLLRTHILCWIMK